MRSRLHMAAMVAAIVGSLPADMLNELAEPYRRDQERRPRLPPLPGSRAVAEVAGPPNDRQVAAEAKRARKNAKRLAGSAGGNKVK